MRESRDIDDLLKRWRGGDKTALDEVVTLLYPELRRLARRLLLSEWKYPQLEPTELVSELYLNLRDMGPVEFKGYDHFFASSRESMRRIHVRTLHRQKRGPSVAGFNLDTLFQLRSAEYESATDPLMRGFPPEPSTELDVDAISLSVELEKLAILNARQYTAVRLIYFSGFTTSETAEVLGVSMATVTRDLRSVKNWLWRRLSTSPRMEGTIFEDPPLVASYGDVKRDVISAIALLRSVGLGEITIEDAGRALESGRANSELEFSISTIARHTLDLLHGVELLSSEIGTIAKELHADIAAVRAGLI